LVGKIMKIIFITACGCSQIKYYFDFGVPSNLVLRLPMVPKDFRPRDLNICSLIRFRDFEFHKMLDEDTAEYREKT
jgi:hypothetical protein